jgi:hypothetical protein
MEGICVTTRRLLLVVVAVGGLGLCPGCVSIEFHRPVWPTSWPWEDAPEAGEVNQVIAMWSDGVVVQPDPSQEGKPTPGFNGKIYLLDARTGKACAATGSVVISLYDAAAPPGAPPREVWEIDADTLRRVARKDGVGWGYAVWLPWTTADPSIFNVTLAVHYKPARGSDVWSNHSTIRVRDGQQLTPPSQLATTSRRTPG